MAPQRFRRVDHVSGKSEAGHVSGRITRVVTSEIEFKGRRRHGSPWSRPPPRPSCRPCAGCRAGTCPRLPGRNQRPDGVEELRGACRQRPTTLVTFWTIPIVPTSHPDTSRAIGARVVTSCGSRDPRPPPRSCSEIVRCVPSGRCWQPGTGQEAGSVRHLTEAAVGLGYRSTNEVGAAVARATGLVRRLASQLRVDSIRCSTNAGSGHPTSSTGEVLHPGS
ncbi:MAG: HVA1 family protein [Candidatus Limnocylindrales bacterium]